MESASPCGTQVVAVRAHDLAAMVRCALPVSPLDEFPRLTLSTRIAHNRKEERGIL
jgi:hypothetical protein